MILCAFSDISIQHKYVHLLRLINKSKKDGFLRKGVGIWQQSNTIEIRYHNNFKVLKTWHI